MDEINTERNMKSICRLAMAQWTERLTRKGQTRVRNWKGANILLSQQRCESRLMSPALYWLFDNLYTLVLLQKRASNECNRSFAGDALRGCPLLASGLRRIRLNVRLELSHFCPRVPTPEIYSERTLSLTRRFNCANSTASSSSASSFLRALFLNAVSGGKQFYCQFEWQKILDNSFEDLLICYKLWETFPSIRAQIVISAGLLLWVHS